MTEIVPNLIVSRETEERLHAFADLVRKWTPKINLISKNSLDDLWDRHIVDSIQVFQLAPVQGDWLDIGSGGGFPGIVAAILSAEFSPNRQFTLVDSDQRKCAFLRTAARELSLKATVLSDRVEGLDPIGASILSARALGDLTALLQHAHRHLASGGVALFPKGKTWQEEHELAQKTWSYRAEMFTSTTNPDAMILRIEDPKLV